MFMAAGYSSGWPLVRTRPPTMSAKRHAEMAPGVGKRTDLIIIRKTGILLCAILRRTASAVAAERTDPEGRPLTSSYRYHAVEGGIVRADGADARLAKPPRDGSPDDSEPAR